MSEQPQKRSKGANPEALFIELHALRIAVGAVFDQLIQRQILTKDDMIGAKALAISAASGLTELTTTQHQVGGDRTIESLQTLFEVWGLPRDRTQPITLQSLLPGS